MTRTINADPYGKIALQGYDPVAVELLRGQLQMHTGFRFVSDLTSQ